MPKQEDYDLGTKAVELSFITQEQLEEAIMDLCALERVGSQKGLEDVLIQKGLLDESKLEQLKGDGQGEDAASTPEEKPEGGVEKLQSLIAEDEEEEQEAPPAEMGAISDTAVPSAGPSAPTKPIAPPSVGKPPGSRMKTPITLPANNASEYCFIHLSGQGEARIRVLPKKPIAIGREPANDIVVLDGPVSKRHARLTFAPEGMTLWDVGSKNGTFVNDEKITSKKLKEGDAVRVGNAYLIFGRVDTPDGRIAGTLTPNAPEQNALAMLSGKDGFPPGTKFVVGESPLLIGSEGPNNVCLDDASLSPFHAHVAGSPEGVRIADLSSATGIKVNGEDVEAKVLEEGDIISIGRYTLNVDMVKEAPGSGEGQPIPATRAPTAALTPRDPVAAAEEFEERRQELLADGGEEDPLGAELPELNSLPEDKPADLPGLKPLPTKEDAEKSEMKDLAAALKQEVGLADAGQAEMARPGKSKLICIAGVIKSKSFPVDVAKMTFGRNPASDIFLEDLSVSREHAMIKATGDKLEVVDLGSRNGVEVNGCKVMSKILNVGDKVKIGKNVFLIELA